MGDRIEHLTPTGRAGRLTRRRFLANAALGTVAAVMGGLIGVLARGGRHHGGAVRPGRGLSGVIPRVGAAWGGSFSPTVGNWPSTRTRAACRRPGQWIQRRGLSRTSTPRVTVPRRGPGRGTDLRRRRRRQRADAVLLDGGCGRADAHRRSGRRRFTTGADGRPTAADQLLRPTAATGLVRRVRPGPATRARSAWCSSTTATIIRRLDGRRGCWSRG